MPEFWFLRNTQVATNAYKPGGGDRDQNQLSVDFTD
jgi:hypothetical protein